MTPQDDLQVLRADGFVRVLARLEDLLSQSARAFLLGAGCSKCAGLPLTGELTSKALVSPHLTEPSKALLRAIEVEFTGSTDSTIEDYLSELIDLLAIAERRGTRGAASAMVTVAGAAYGATQLQAALVEIKRSIQILISGKVETQFHRRLVRAVHQPLRPGRAPSLPVDYVVLNYDTLVEDALALERVPHTDGLDGGSTAWWAPGAFRRAGISARVLKLHGSIDWCELADDPLPRRIPSHLGIVPDADRRVLIWPASTKYSQTQHDPYAQVLGEVRRTLRPESNLERVLVICGYRFGDAHVNAEIEQALRTSHRRLTVIALTEEERPTGQLGHWAGDPAVGEQVIVLARRAFVHAEARLDSDSDLPWWKFENLVRLLEGER